MFKEFKEFALKGNIIDLAVGVIIGGAFQKIVNSLVNDIIMPTIAIFAGKVDYTELSVTIGESSIKYGSFVTEVINFLIIAMSIFLMIKYINKLKEAFENRWIDVYAVPNKRGGAYSMGVYGCHPFLLTNFVESKRDVSTIAHELGHAMHSYYSALKLQFSYPLNQNIV